MPRTSETKEKKPRPSTNILSQKMLRNPVSSRLNQAVQRKKWLLTNLEMIQMAVGADTIVPQKPREKRHQTFLIAKKPERVMDPNLNPKNLGQRTLNTFLKIQLTVEALDSVFSGAIEASRLLSSKRLTMKC